MEKYQEVPNIITGKDLDYLSDMFEWNINALKRTNDCIPKVKSTDIINMLKEACKLFEYNLNVILTLLEGGINERN